MHNDIAEMNQGSKDSDPVGRRTAAVCFRKETRIVDEMHRPDIELTSFGTCPSFRSQELRVALLSESEKSKFESFLHSTEQAILNLQTDI
jgi:hypothetical protein